MASWKRARAADRDAAVELINAAYADEQITLAEREDKVSRALAARTLGDVQQTTADLQGPTGSGPASATGTENAAVAVRPKPKPKPGRRAGLAIAALAIAAAGTVAVFGHGDDDTAVESPSFKVVVGADLVEDLVADYEGQFGTTRTYGLIVMPQWVRAHVPTDDGHGRYTEWTLEADGNLVQSKGPVGAKDARPFDLAALDAAALAESIRKARDSLDVEGNVEASVEITHRPYDDEPSVTVTMRNEFGESGYLVTDLAGRVSGTYPYDPA